jgi:hypothetical protein
MRGRRGIESRSVVQQQEKIMITKIAVALMTTLVLGLASTATISAANAQSRYGDSGYTSGGSYGEAPNESARDRACATGCGGD